MRHRMGDEAERARLHALIGRADAESAFTRDYINPFLGIVVRVLGPRVAKLMKRGGSRWRAAKQRILSLLASTDEVLLEEQGNRDHSGFARRRKCR